MFDYSEYVDDVLYQAPIGVWMEPLIQELLLVLFENDVLVDHIWLSISRCGYASIKAICIDENEQNAQCTAIWEGGDYVMSRPSSWELISVELDDLPRGFDDHSMA